MDRLIQLRAFVRLVERGSFSAVADELHVKQSTVSKWLASLESEAGVRLIDRTTRSQRATEAGEQLYARGQSILAAYDQAMSEAREGHAVLRGRIRMSLPAVFGRVYVVPLVIAFLQEHDALEIDMSLGDRYVSLVEEGYDLAIRIGVQVDSSLQSHPLGESSRRVVASPAYLEAHGTPLTPRELEHHECLVHAEPGAQTLWRFTREGKSHRAKVRGRVAINHSEATLELARAGLGICMLASWLVDEDVEAGRLVALLEGYTPPSAPVRALTPPGRHVPARTRLLLEHLRRGLSSL